MYGFEKAEREEDFKDFEQLRPLFKHLKSNSNNKVEMLLWGVNQGEAVNIAPKLKAKVDARTTTKTKTCHYVEVAFLQRVKTSHNVLDNR